MKPIRILVCSFLLIACSGIPLLPAHAQIAVGISVDIAPPPLPVYDQPPIPASGYLWVPGYWAWDDNTGYYWVPGTWVPPPEPELLWTPGYWGWSDGVYVFHEGYWGPQIGFYGGVAYGFGYTGLGYEGGYWRNGSLFYNQSVNNISNMSITNVYSKTVVMNNTSNVSYNGGVGGTNAQPTPQQLAAEKERHVPPTAQQKQNVEAAAKDPSLSLNSNHGHPAVAATAHPGQFKGQGIVAAHPGQPVAAVQPQGHRINTPGKTTIGPGEKVAPGGAAAHTTPGPAVGPSHEHKGTAGTPATPGTSTAPNGPNIREHKGEAGGASMSHDEKPSADNPSQKSHATLPPAHTAPPPPPHSHPAASPPPTQHAVAPPPHPTAVKPAPPPSHASAPPPRPAAPAGKPKCQPGQHC